MITMWLCALTASAVRGDVLPVPSGPYPTIQSAIEAADPGDTVVVAPGTYLENINFGGQAITVRSADPDDPNTVAATIIDGSAPADPNHASVVTFNSGETNASILEGLTITGGMGTWLVISWDLHEFYWNRCGGGIVCYNLSAPTLRKCRITGNLAGEGGGLYVYGNPVNPYPSLPSDPPVHIQPVITQNLFESNNAITDHGFDPPDDIYTLENHGDGGAIVCFQGVDPQITNNTIQNNHADSYGGGIHIRQWSNGRISDNNITLNNSSIGGGIHITYRSSSLIQNNQITANTTGGGGGGIYIYYLSNPVIKNNFLKGNHSYTAAGIGVYFSSQPVIENNLIVQNYGSGILCTGSGDTIIMNNTISDNYFNISGGGIRYSYSDLLTIHGNIITSNQGEGINGDMNSPTALIKFNNVWGNDNGNYHANISDQTGINGNISIDPNFAPDSFHLMPISPCRDAGDPATADTGDFDIDDEPRIEDSRVDIGADEVYFSPADYNTSGRVDINDLVLFLAGWLGPDDMNTFSEFAGQWLWQGKWLNSEQ